MGFAKAMGLPDSDDTGNFNIMRDGADELMLGCWVREPAVRACLERYRKKYPNMTFYIVEKKEG